MKYSYTLAGFIFGVMACSGCVALSNNSIAYGVILIGLSLGGFITCTIMENR